MKLSLYFGRCCTARNFVVDVLLVGVLVTITVMIQLQLHPQLLHHHSIDAFVPLISSHPKQQLWKRQHHRGTALYANKPQRLDDNVDGAVYVNDRVSCMELKNDDVFTGNASHTIKCFLLFSIVFIYMLISALTVLHVLGLHHISFVHPTNMMHISYTNNQKQYRILS